MGEGVSLFGVGVTIGLFLISHAFTRRYNRRREKAIRRLQYAQNVITNARETANGYPVHRPYGLTWFAASPPVYLGVGTRFQPGFPSNRFGHLAAGTRGKDSLLLAQYVLTNADVQIRKVYIDKVDVFDMEQPEQGRASHIEYTNSPDTLQGERYIGNATATRFCSDTLNTSVSGQRNDTSHFYPLSYLTCVFHLDLGKPAFRNTPVIETVLERTTPDFERFGETYRISTTQKSNNLVSVIAEEINLISNDRGSSTLTIDVDSFGRAWEIANRVVQGTGSVILDDAIPSALRDSIGIDGTENYRQILTRLGFDSATDPGISRQQVLALKRYEFNGIVDASQTRVEALETLLEHMPEAKLFRSVTGLWKLSVPDGQTAEHEQVVGTVGPNELVEPVAITWPDSSRRFNRVRVNFANIDKDFAQDEITFPREGSILEQHLLSEDNDADLSTTLHLEGSHNQYHANSVAATTLLVSRRELYTFTMRPIGFVYEPGDVLRIQDDTQQIDVFARVDSTRVLENLDIEINALRFSKDDYAWYPDTPETLSIIPPIVRRPRTPQSITSSYNETTGLATVRWVAHPDENIWTVGYALEHSTESGIWQSVAFTNQRGGGTFSQYPGLAPATHFWRVRSIGVLLQYSDWIESDGLLIEPESLAGAGVEFAYSADDDGEIPAGEEPSNNWGFRSLGSSNGRTWSSSGAVLTQENPLLVRYSRAIEGTPSVGDQIEDPWRYDGIVGGLGRDGTDGQGREWIFTVYESEDLPDAANPSNDWAFDEPGVAGGLTWYDGAPDLTEENPFLFSSFRTISGDNEVTSEWSSPVVVGRYGIDGEDGTGKETIFAGWLSDSLTSNQYPFNHWQFEGPYGQVNGVIWRDDAPGLTRQFPYLFSSSRPVRGSEPRGNWSTPALISQLGADGTAQGFEFAFRRTENDTPIPARPQSNSVYQAPGSPWSSTQISLTEEFPWLWSTSRTTRTETTGTIVGNSNWSTPVIIGHYGADGDTETVETIWAATSTNSVSAPSNSWPADSPQAPWSDTAPELTEATPWLWVSNRVGDGNWSTPTIAGHFGIDGRQGEDGAGIEFIFTVTGKGSTGVPITPSTPDNTWAFDNPGGGWTDAATPVSEQTPFLWSSSRPITGTTPSGEWSVPAIIGSFGPPGEDGATIGTETAYQGTTGANAPALPSDLAPVGNPGGGWSTSQPSIRQSTPYVWATSRMTRTNDQGVLVGDTSWSAAALVGQWAVSESPDNGGTDPEIPNDPMKPDDNETPSSPSPPSASTNNRLASLSISTGTLTPSFNAFTQTYTAQVGSGISQITVNATTQDSAATITQGLGSHSLAVGETRISIIVRAESNHTRTYQITVTRPSAGPTDPPVDPPPTDPEPQPPALSSNANLATLTIAPGSLSPSFSPSITSYSVWLTDQQSSSVFVSATTQDAAATLTGTGSHSAIPGSTITVRVRVTAQDGTTKNYTIQVSQEEDMKG